MYLELEAGCSLVSYVYSLYSTVCTLNCRQGAGSPARSIIRPMAAMYSMFSSYFSALQNVCVIMCIF